MLREKLKTAKKEYIMKLPVETLSSNCVFWKTLPTLNRKKLKKQSCYFLELTKKGDMGNTKNQAI